MTAATLARRSLRVAARAQRKLAAREIGRGSRVTKQPTHWYSGEPVKGWPDANYVATVLRTENVHGLPMARVKYPTGRIEWELVSELRALPQ